MRIEHFKQFDVARYDRDKVAFVFTLELRGRKPAHGFEHLVADKSQKLECYIMVARLLAVMQKSPQNGKDYNADAAGFIAVPPLIFAAVSRVSEPATVI